MYSPDTTKYLIHIHIETEGVVEKPDVIGAIFGQTEGLLGEDMDLRDLQRSGRVGRIDVQITSKHGKTTGELYIASSLDRAETAILAASLETIERVGPCVSLVKVHGIEDLRAIKRRQIVDRAKELLLESFDDVGISTNDILAEVREAIRVEKISTIGDERVPAGPNVLDSDAIIIVEGRADVLNLLKCGIKNTVAVEGTKVPQTVIDLAIKKNTTVFVDGDRGGDLILQELMQVAEIDYVAFSPRGRSVEDMTRKEIVKSLRNKIPAENIRAQILKNEPISDLVFEINSEKDDSDDEVIEAVAAAPLERSEECSVEEVPIQIESEVQELKDSKEMKTEHSSEPKEEQEEPKEPKGSEEPEEKTSSKRSSRKKVQSTAEVSEAAKAAAIELPLSAVAAVSGVISTSVEEAVAAEPAKTKAPSLRVAEPKTIAEHAEWMKQSGRARLLTADAEIYGDYSVNEMLNLLPNLKAEVAGVIIDAPVNQKFIDTAVQKGFQFVVAKKFDGIVRRPVSLRMIQL